MYKKWRRKVRTHHIKNALLFLVCLALLGASFALIWLATLKLPNLDSFDDRQVAQSTKIYDRTGTVLLYEVSDNARRTLVPSSAISVYVKNATVAIEDEHFYEHHGVELSSFIRAVYANLVTHSFSQGGSTITQQVVKNSLLTTSKTISRKIKEWILAYELDRAYDKDTILAYYLNGNPYGGNIYGVERASETFFHKKASEVTLAEAAYLAAIPNAPTYYSPYGSHLSDLEARKNLVLKKMLDNNFITKAEYDSAMAEKVAFEPLEDNTLKAPHFVEFIKEYLEEKYGNTAVLSGGLKVITTLDYSLEKIAEDIVKKYALQNSVTFNASNAALVAIDPQTGQILVMVGSRDYFDKEIDGNFNVALAHRQPGSSFKPFVYATAFKKGYTPDTEVFDLPTEFSTYCNPDGSPINPKDADKCYMPVNYDGKFLGPVSFRDALAQSRNVPAIKVLYLAGLRDSLQTAQDMGITSLSDPNKYGLTLVLGGGEVSLLDMTSAYSVFANEGVRNPYTGILEIDDSSGAVLEKFEPNPSTALDRQIALTMSDILNDNVARTPEFGANSALYFPGQDVAVKTGTTNDYKDAWIIGYTPNFAAGAWAGNNDNSPMQKKIAGFIVAPLWHDFMVQALATRPKQFFPAPDPVDQSKLKPVLRGFWQGNVLYTINKTNGKLATASTPPALREDKVVTNVHSILYWVSRDNPLGDPPTDPAADPQFALWEYPVQKWAAENGVVSQTNAVIPTQVDDSNYSATLRVLSPQNGTTYSAASRLTISIEPAGNFALSRVDAFLNDRYLGSATGPNFTLSFIPKDEQAKSAGNDLRLVGYDALGNTATADVTFNTN